MTSLYETLLGKRTNPNGTLYNEQSQTQQSAKSQKLAYQTTATVVTVKTFSNGDTRVNLLIHTVTPAMDGETHPMIVSAKLDRSQVKMIPYLVPGILVSARVLVKHGNVRTFYDCINMNILNEGRVDLSVFDDKPQLFQVPTCGAQMKQYDILFPLTPCYMGELKEGPTNGFLIARPTSTQTDDKYGLKREYDLNFAQWVNTDNPIENHTWHQANVRLDMKALGCFGITDETHWVNDEYADKWLLGTDYVVRTFLSTKSYEYMMNRSDDFPKKFFAIASDVYVDLNRQVRTIGTLCNQEKVSELLQKITPTRTKKTGNRYTDHPSQAIVNVNESDHQIDHDKYDYYVVTVDDESIFDLFALRKQ